MVCGKYRKVKNPKNPKIYVFEKRVLSVVCSKCGNKDKNIFKEE